MGILPGDGFQRRLMAAVAALLIVGVGMIAALTGRETADRPPAPAQTPAPAEKLPLSGRVILVDPGHGGYDGGALCQESGIWEKAVNLAVALETEKSLTRLGAQVVMTRRTDEDLCSEDRPAGQTMKRQDMERRVAMAVDAGADMVLSIHMNEYRDRRQSGPQVFYRAGCDAGRLLAGCLQASLLSGLQPEKERAAADGDYFILQLPVPSALVECGFISNPQEEALLLDPAYQTRVAEAIAEGAAAYFTLADRLTKETR